MKDDSLSDVVNEDCTCGRHHLSGEFTCHRCGKLVPAVIWYEEASTIPNSVGKEFSPNEETNVYEKEIWNKAIEEAAIWIQNNVATHSKYADGIRRLKK